MRLLCGVEKADRGRVQRLVTQTDSYRFCAFSSYISLSLSDAPYYDTLSFLPMPPKAAKSSGAKQASIHKNKIVFNRFAQQTEPILYAQLRHQAGAILIYTFLMNLQILCDFTAGIPLSNQL